MALFVMAYHRFFKNRLSRELHEAYEETVNMALLQSRRTSPCLPGCTLQSMTCKHLFLPSLPLQLAKAQYLSCAAGGNGTIKMYH